MAGTYSFKIDTRRDLVSMELHGFFTPDQMPAFDQARREAYSQLRCAPNQHVTVVDMRGTLIQSQDIVDAFARSIADQETKSRRIAFVVSRSLARLQVKRAAGDRDAGYFLTLDEAERWLLDERTEAA